MPHDLRPQPSKLAAFVLLFLLVTPTAAAQLAGYTKVVSVTDENKHTTKKEKDVTFLHYIFEFSQNAPNPNALLERDRIGTARVVLNVNHQYHTDQLFPRNVVEDNDVTYIVFFNGMTIEYRTHLRVEDTGWNLAKLFSRLEPRGHVTMDYRVYNESGVLVADEHDEETISTIGKGIPDSRLWIRYENKTLTVAPDFTAHGFLPLYTQPDPPDNPGTVRVFNTTLDSLELQIVSRQTLDNVKMAFGFARPGNDPDFTLGSLLQDAATSVAGLLGNVLNTALDLVISIIPQGQKLHVVKEYVSLVVGVVWDVLVQDPVLLAENILIFAIAYGLLLFIDPMFVWIFKPLWFLGKGIWKALVWFWDFGVKIVSLIAGKLPG